MILVDTNIKECCAKFYCPELDHNIRVRDQNLRVSHSGRNACLQCWNYYKDMYGKLGWKLASNSDISYSIKVDDNRKRVVTSEGETKGKETVEPLDL